MPKSELETCLTDIMSDLRDQNPILAEKYQEKLDVQMYTITPEEAHQIVTAMKPKGEKFSMEYIKALLAEKEQALIEETIIKYYLVMNMEYNDYQLLFEKFPMLNQKDAYYIMAHCFINDIDAPKHKVAKYFLMK